MKSEPVRVSTLISPLNTAMPINADRQEASALRRSDLAPSVAEGLGACAGQVTNDRSANESFKYCELRWRGMLPSQKHFIQAPSPSHHCLQIENDSSTTPAREMKVPS